MSKIGKRSIAVPKEIKVGISGSSVSVEGSKGKTVFSLPPGISAALKEDNLFITRDSDEKQTKAFHGLARAQLNNMIKGMKEGFSRELEIIGVGYRAQVSGKNLVLTLGFSHPVNFPVPEGISIETPKPTQIVVKGSDKQRVGETAAEIRKLRKPEPYKGKGIRYVGEYVRRKAGKAVA